MRCRGVGRREVGEKCCGMQGCRVGGRPGVRSCHSIVMCGQHEGKQSRRRRTPILGASAMSLVGFLGIWCRRRGVRIRLLPAIAFGDVP